MNQHVNLSVCVERHSDFITIQCCHRVDPSDVLNNTIQIWKNRSSKRIWNFYKNSIRLRSMNFHSFKLNRLFSGQRIRHCIQKYDPFVSFWLCTRSNSEHLQHELHFSSCKWHNSMSGLKSHSSSVHFVPKISVDGSVFFDEQHGPWNSTCVDRNLVSLRIFYALWRIVEKHRWKWFDALLFTTMAIVSKRKEPKSN